MGEELIVKDGPIMPGMLFYSFTLNDRQKLLIFFIIALKLNISEN